MPPFYVAFHVSHTSPVRAARPRRVHNCATSKHDHKETGMGNRLSKIATRTGDAGTTGLGDGSRVGKNSLRIVAIGDVDELNSISACC
jgi:cob(I)alamin adenosyltransferase